MLPWGCACDKAVYTTCTQHHNQRLPPWHGSRQQQNLQRSIHTTGQLDRKGDYVGRNLKTKLTRRSAGALHLWLRYPGWLSGSGQPDSPPQSSQLLRVRWARGNSHRWRVISHRWRMIIGPSTPVSGPRIRQDKSRWPRIRHSRAASARLLRPRAATCREADLRGLGGAKAPWLLTKRLCRHLEWHLSFNPSYRVQVVAHFNNNNNNNKYSFQHWINILCIAISS